MFRCLCIGYNCYITEIGQFTEFIVDDKCDEIDPIFDKYFYITLEGHNTYFEVKEYLKSGCWLLFTSAIIFFISSKYCYERIWKCFKRISSLPNLNESNNISKY